MRHLCDSSWDFCEVSTTFSYGFQNRQTSNDSVTRASTRISWYSRENFYQILISVQWDFYGTLVLRRQRESYRGLTVVPSASHERSRVSHLHNDDAVRRDKISLPAANFPYMLYSILRRIFLQVYTIIAAMTNVVDIFRPDGRGNRKIVAAPEVDRLAVSGAVQARRMFHVSRHLWATKMCVSPPAL